MKGLSVEKAFHTVTEAFQNCLKRFPVTVAFIFAFTAYLIHLTSISWTGEERLLFITGYYLSVGILLSLTLHLWSEEVKSRMWKTGIQLAAHALLIADAFLLYRYLGTESSWIEIGIAHTAAILTIGLSTFFLSFLREKNDIASWNFALNAVSSFAVTQIIGLPLLAPFAKTAQVDAKSKNCRRRLHHRLIEMRRCQPGFPVSVTGYNYAIHLHVSNRRSTERGFKQII